MEITMKMESREHENLIIFDIDGDFDARSASKAKENIRATILEGNINIIINLENVSYIDSAGLGTLVSALKTAKENGGNVWLTGLSNQVKMVIELTRLYHVFDIYENIDEALNDLANPEQSEPEK